MSGQEIATHGLPNGLKVVVAADHRVPVAAISLWYAVGSAHERAGRSGFAHLFEHLMFQGSAHVRKAEHFQAIQAVGGRANAYTGLDATVYSDTVPSHQLELALWLEADRMATLGEALTQETLDNQREVVKSERRKKVDNVPYGTWEEESFALLFPSQHPYHHSSWGSLEELSRGTLDDAREFFADYYVPNNATLVVAGDMEVDAALEAVARHFEAIQPRELPVSPEHGSSLADGGARREIAERVPLPRVYVSCLVPRFGHDGFDAADLLTDLLATGRASRLQARLVRELRVAQSVDAWVFQLVRGASVLMIEVSGRSAVEPDAIEAALNAELDRLAGEPVADEELERVRTQRATRRAAAMERAADRADRIGMYASLLGDAARFNAERARDEAVGPDDVQALARAWLATPRRVHVWYLPARD